MAWGLFEALGSVWESVRGFTAGILGRGAREGVEWGTISEALTPDLSPEMLADLSPDFFLQERQAEIALGILEMPQDYMIPISLHLETDRLLPHAYVYEVSVTQYDAAGNIVEHPYYVGSDQRLSQDEILEIADGEVENSPAEGAIGYEIGGIVAAWVRQN